MPAVSEPWWWQLAYSNRPRPRRYQARSCPQRRQENPRGQRCSKIARRHSSSVGYSCMNSISVLGCLISASIARAPKATWGTGRKGMGMCRPLQARPFPGIHRGPSWRQSGRLRAASPCLLPSANAARFSSTILGEDAARWPPSPCSQARTRTAPGAHPRPRCWLDLLAELLVGELGEGDARALQSPVSPSERTRPSSQSSRPPGLVSRAYSSKAGWESTA